MFKEHKDTKIAMEVFLAVFGAEDKKTKRELFSFFFDGFKDMYDRNRADLNHFRLPLTHYFDGARMFVMEAKGKNNEDKALCLGKSLGTFLVAIDYGVVNPKPHIEGETAEEILASVKGFSEALKEIEKNVNKRYIKRRIGRIATENKNKLNGEQKLLLAGIEAEFTS